MNVIIMNMPETQILGVACRRVCKSIFRLHGKSMSVNDFKIDANSAKRKAVKKNPAETYWHAVSARTTYFGAHIKSYKFLVSPNEVKMHANMFYDKFALPNDDLPIGMQFCSAERYQKLLQTVQKNSGISERF